MQFVYKPDTPCSIQCTVLEHWRHFVMVKCSIYRTQPLRPFLIIIKTVQEFFWHRQMKCLPVHLPLYHCISYEPVLCNNIVGTSNPQPLFSYSLYNFYGTLIMIKGHLHENIFNVKLFWSGWNFRNWMWYFDLWPLALGHHQFWSVWSILYFGFSFEFQNNDAFCLGLPYRQLIWLWCEWCRIMSSVSKWIKNDLYKLVQLVSYFLSETWTYKITLFHCEHTF